MSSTGRWRSSRAAVSRWRAWASRSPSSAGVRCWRRQGRTMPMARMRSAAGAARPACGPVLPGRKVDLKALKTLPPKPYTQGELIKAMKTVAKFVTDPRLKQKLRDTTGIGTEATRANIINGLIGRGYGQERPCRPRFRRGIHAYRRGALGHRRPRHHGSVGAGARHDRGRPDGAGHLHREAVRVARPARAAVSRRNALAQAAAGAGLPAVRRTDAAAHGQERRVLVLLALPGLQGHVADRVPDGPAQRTAQAARCLKAS